MGLTSCRRITIATTLVRRGASDTAIGITPTAVSPERAADRDGLDPRGVKAPREGGDHHRRSDEV